MLNAAFRGHRLGQFVLAAALFALAGVFHQEHRKDEAEKVLALRQGVPAPVSLNAFDPEKDIHSADDVHVIGWINTGYNHELTETRARRSDVVRRMFVLFGPEDTAETGTARAVVLMSEEDVDRFVDGLLVDMVGGCRRRPGGLRGHGADTPAAGSGARGA